ncbi:MAG: helix-turn-helix domain-containing protein [Sandaracinaceae bacterium]|nr:helix-turn-helix domain-containing protein [Sandaracinaceae bacterium]
MRLRCAARLALAPAVRGAASWWVAVPTAHELTTQQAADLLNVSRQYLVRLLDEGRIACRKTGTHRRLRVTDVLEFKARRDKDRRAGLRELSQLTQDAGGYDAELK